MNHSRQISLLLLLLLLRSCCVVEAHPRFFGIMGETFVALTNSEKLLKFLWDFTPLQLNCHIKVLSLEVSYDDFCYYCGLESKARREKGGGKKSIYTLLDLWVSPRSHTILGALNINKHNNIKKSREEEKRRRY